MFDGKCTDSLASLHYIMYVKERNSAKSRHRNVCTLTKYHCLRASYQIVVWIGREGDIDVTNWGWKPEENLLVPIMVPIILEMNDAPDNLLKMIHCNCLASSQTPCCTCRRYGLPCDAVCGVNLNHVTIQIISL